MSGCPSRGPMAMKYQWNFSAKSIPVLGSCDELPNVLRDALARLYFAVEFLAPRSKVPGHQGGADPDQQAPVRESNRLEIAYPLRNRWRDGRPARCRAQCAHGQWTRQRAQYCEDRNATQDHAPPFQCVPFSMVLDCLHAREGRFSRSPARRR